MNVFLTGATGFIGGALANRLAVAGHLVRAAVRPGSDVSRLDTRVQLLTGHLDDESFLAGALAEADAVCHLAGTTKAFSAQGFRRVNEDLTRQLVAAVDKYSPAHQVLLHVSSQAAGGPCATPPGLAETDRSAPVSQYGLSKFLGERAAFSLAPERRVAVIRPPMVYGPGDRAFVPLYRLMALGVLTTPGPASQPFSIVHVADLVAGMEMVLNALANGRAASGVFHLDGPAPSTWTDYAEAFGQALFSQTLKRRVRPLRVPLPLLALSAWGNAFLNALGLPTSHLTPDKYREARQAGWLLDCAKARRELGYAPRVDLTSGAAETIAWCRTQGLL
jgi:nucleoside-diphosphate-sugar epimerase